MDSTSILYIRIFRKLKYNRILYMIAYLYDFLGME